MSRAAVAVAVALAVSSCSGGLMTAPPASDPSPSVGTAAPSPAGQGRTAPGGPTSFAPITVLAPTDSPAPTGSPTPTAAVVPTSTEPTGEAEPTRTEPIEGQDPETSGTVINSAATVVIDPGHNGGNAANPAVVGAPVPAGFGRTKACNTTGTATDAGYAEHALNWAVAGYLRDWLQAAGVTVILTRDSDDGVGPCVDERAAIGNDAGADAVISIHGDGADPSVHGFFVMTAERVDAADPVDPARSGELAAAIRDGMVAAGFTVSNGLGTDGLWQRDDLAGLTLSARPTVMVELGNMRNADDAAQMTTARGQKRYAAALAAGITAYVAAQQ